MVVLGTRTLDIYFEPDSNLTESILGKISEIEEIYKNLSLLETDFNDRFNIKVGNQTL